MKIAAHESFISAIVNTQKARLSFRSDKSGIVETRTVAPIDYGPHPRYPLKGARYHFYDYSSPSGAHHFNKPAQDIVSFELLSESFDPSLIEGLPKSYSTPRNW
jgi:hypothetical protein